MSNLLNLAFHQTPQPRHERGRNASALLRCPGRDKWAAEGRSLRQPLIEERGGARDEVDGVVVALLRCVAPTDDAMPRQHDAAQSGSGAHIVLQPQAKIETRPLPPQPAHAVAVDLARGRFTVRRSGERDDGVRMHVIDVGKGQQGV